MDNILLLKRIRNIHARGGDTSAIIRTIGFWLSDVSSTDDGRELVNEGVMMAVLLDRLGKFPHLELLVERIEEQEHLLSVRPKKKARRRVRTEKANVVDIKTWRVRQGCSS